MKKPKAKPESRSRRTDDATRSGNGLSAGEKPAMDHSDDIHRIRAMPKEFGVLLIVAGIGGVLLPGPVGTPLLVLGGVMLWPNAIGRLEAFFERRFPRTHHLGIHQINRFIDDLERRYPTPK
jgi:hypothetical protein